MKKVLAWHFVRGSRRLRHDASHLIAEPGCIYTCDQKPVVCKVGLHAGIYARTAYAHALVSQKHRLWVCRVRLWGDISRSESDNILAARNREILWMAEATEKIREYRKWARETSPYSTDVQLQALVEGLMLSLKADAIQ